MNAPFRPAAAPPRREVALAYIVERIVRNGTSPSSVEIGYALGVSKQRAQQLVDQLIAAQILERTPGARSLRIRDLTYCRHVIVETLRQLGLTVAEPMGELQCPLPIDQLPMLPPFEHLPDPE